MRQQSRNQSVGYLDTLVPQLTVSAPAANNESADHLFTNSISALEPTLSIAWDKNEGLCRFSLICCFTNWYGCSTHCFKVLAIRRPVLLNAVPGNPSGRFFTCSRQPQVCHLVGGKGSLRNGMMSTSHLPGIIASEKSFIVAPAKSIKGSGP